MAPDPHAFVLWEDPPPRRAQAIAGQRLTAHTTTKGGGIMSPATTSPIRGLLREARWHSDDSLAILYALCPACGFEHGFCVDPDGTGRHHTDTWEFDGNYERPTFSPSMGANIHGTDAHKPRCHSFVRNGQWVFLGDCTHDMAGQTVEMIPPDPAMGFERRHGWHLYPWCDPVTGKPRQE